MCCGRQKLTLIEKKINFSISGSNEFGPFKAKVSSFMQLSRCPDSAILIARVTTGKIKKADVLKIDLPDLDPVWEVAENIQMNKRDIPESILGKSIGIKLRELTFETLKKINNATAIFNETITQLEV